MRLDSSVHMYSDSTVVCLYSVRPYLDHSVHRTTYVLNSTVVLFVFCPPVSTSDFMLVHRLANLRLSYYVVSRTYISRIT